MAFIRGFARERSATLANFWVDLVRRFLWVLLPVSLVGSLLLVWQGVPLNAAPYTVARTLKGREQLIAQGPVAALEFIKDLGTNGGGFFNVNGAHPYEDPTPLVMVALVGIFMAGLMIGRTPEYLGKTIKATEAKLIAGYTVLTPVVVTLLTAWAVAIGAGPGGSGHQRRLARVHRSAVRLRLLHGQQRPDPGGTERQPPVL